MVARKLRNPENKLIDVSFLSVNCDLSLVIKNNDRSCSKPTPCFGTPKIRTERNVVDIKSLERSIYKLLAHPLTNSSLEAEDGATPAWARSPLRALTKMTTYKRTRT